MNILSYVIPDFVNMALHFIWYIYLFQDRDTDEPDQVMKIPLPGALKKQLVDDWEFVTQHGKVEKIEPCTFFYIF